MSTKHLIFTSDDIPDGPVDPSREIAIMGAVVVADGYRPAPHLIVRATEAGLNLVVGDTPELPDFILSQGEMFLTRLTSAAMN